MIGFTVWVRADDACCIVTTCRIRKQRNHATTYCTGQKTEHCCSDTTYLPMAPFLRLATDLAGGNERFDVGCSALYHHPSCFNLTSPRSRHQKKC